MDALQSISQSLKFDLSASYYTLNLTADAAGVVTNTYYFTSGSTTTYFSGSFVSESIHTLPSTSNTIYFTTSSFLNDSVYSLSSAIGTLSFASSSVSSSYSGSGTGSVTQSFLNSDLLRKSN